MRLSEAEATIEQGERPIWLCTLGLPDGRALRLATRPVEVATVSLGGDGPYQYDPFLVGVSEFEEEIDLFSLDGVGALTQAQVEICTPDTELGALQSDWHHVIAATVELAILWDGQAWEERVVVLSGSVQGAEFGIEGQATTLSLETTPPSTSETIGDDERDLGLDWEAVVDTAAVPMSDLAGSKYQHVYGAPESVPAYKVGEVSPGFNRLVLCGHHLARTGGSYVVAVYQDGGYVGDYTVVNGEINGQPYAYVESSTEFLASDGAYTWKATHGGIAAANGSDRPALNAEGVIRRMLVDSRLPVDWRRTEPALARLRDWQIGVYTDEEATAIDVIRDRVLRHLPVVEMSGGEGLWLAYADPHLAPVEAQLTLGQELLGRVGRMRMSDPESIRNVFVVNYGREAFAQELLSTVRLDADNSALCALSQQLYGVRADEPIDCDVTWDDATALRIASARAGRLALPRRVLAYELAPELYWLRAGTVVSVTDPGYSIARHRGVIARVNRTMLPFVATIELVDRTPIARGG